MITIKKRTKSHNLLAHEALFRRIHPRYRKNEKLLAEYLKYRAGFYGERNLDYKLSLFPQKEFLHFPDLRLHNFSNYFQMDSIILTPRVIFILETKNIRGILEYDSNLNQFIQITDEKTSSYKDPILQIETQKRQLAYWLEQHNISMPIEPFVVSTNQSTVIRNMDNNSLFNHRFVTLENLLFKLEDIYQSYTKNLININEIRSLYSNFQQYNEPATSNLLELYKIEKRHLIQGIFCEGCERGHYIRRRYDWICGYCNNTSKNNHKRAILDYFLLEENVISNGILREMLSLESRHTAYTLLESMNLSKSGTKKGTIYHAPAHSHYPQNDEPTFMKKSILL